MFDVGDRPTLDIARRWMTSVNRMHPMTCGCIVKQAGAVGGCLAAAVVPACGWDGLKALKSSPPGPGDNAASQARAQGEGSGDGKLRFMDRIWLVGRGGHGAGDD
jgi:hypothetical protein